MVKESNLPAWIAEVTFDEQGLVPAIAQDAQSGRILMVAWMNREALVETVRSGHAVYFSRSRQQLWHKGESSGHTQIVKDVRLDCDGDVILLIVEQIGDIACHTGRQSCFYRQLKENDGTMQWQSVDPVLKDPHDIYK
ncbi:MAG: phosphoribosyl-AMP cyclohydrolase [Burkholderiaceae bacterium]|nr:phosphoribosyl-AMP cyclohydrolase [Burkholderiaceae bacterium]MCD8517381.1 phosphoribosyl-AMP cyclohydrolase [Burkholderiaceae bacterium]MCD8565005.1 phosphoribosyl-AMP cyclohydrolase [Burkholderiaceae bacterium]